MMAAYYPAWEWCLTPVHPSGRMDDPEPLIATYNLEKWKNSAYHGTDIDKICRPTIMNSYRGFRRLVPQKGSDEDQLCDDEDQE